PRDPWLLGAGQGVPDDGSGRRAGWVRPVQGRSWRLGRPGQVPEPPSSWDQASLVLAVEDAAHGAQALLQLGRVLLLDHLAVLAGCVDDAVVAQVDRDVVAVAEQVAGAGLGVADLLAHRLLLVGVAREQLAEAAVHGLHEPRAVEPDHGHAAPL